MWEGVGECGMGCGGVWVWGCRRVCVQGENEVSKLIMNPTVAG